jgi:glycosyltransferase involved in cell wall biosynthesis
MGLPVKIAFFNSARTWGGGEKWHFEMSCALHQLGFETLIFTAQKSELANRLAPSGQRIYRIRNTSLSFLNPFKVWRLARLFQREKIHAIVINLSADLKLAGLAAKLAGVKQVIYRRGSAIAINNTWLNRLIFGHLVTGIIANSQETKNTVLKNNPRLFPADKIRVIYNGLKLEQYDPSPAPRPFARKGDELILGNIGRLVEQKGQHFLVDLAAELKSRRIPVRIMIGGDGPFKTRLVQLARAKDVSDLIQFAGFVDDVKGFLQAIDVFVLTSLWEGFGYVIAEANYFEKPVIAFDISSNPELIEEGINGFLVKLGDVPAMADRVEYLFHHRKAAEAMGKAGRARVDAKFDFKTSLKAFIQYLEKGV